MIEHILVHKETGRVARYRNIPMTPKLGSIDPKKPDAPREFITPYEWSPTPQEGWLIDPDTKAMSGVPDKYWKVVDDKVVEMSTSEKAAADATELTKGRASKIGDIRHHRDGAVQFDHGDKTFTLGPDQRNVLAMLAGVVAQDFQGQEIVWAADDGTNLELDTFAKFGAFRSAAALAVLSHATASQAAETAAMAASDMTQLNAVPVPRHGGKSRRP